MFAVCVLNSSASPGETHACHPKIITGPILATPMEISWLRHCPCGPPAQQGPLQVNVPRYLLRGQGKDEHYEYEVKVSLQSCMDSSTSLFQYIYIDLYI